MQPLRTAIFLIWLYLLMVVMGLICLPSLLGPRSWAQTCFWLWRRLIFFVLRWVGGVTWRVEGAENIPTGGALVASRHESMFETLAMWDILDDPAIILKKELKWLPIFGWWAQKLKNISVDRSAASKALRDMKRQAAQRANEGRQVLIFPEGTRMTPGETAEYKPGVAALYAAMDSPCVPVALHSGHVWRGFGFLKAPGEVVIRVLEPIPPGLDRKAFMSQLKSSIDAASLELAGKAR